MRVLGLGESSSCQTCDDSRAKSELETSEPAVRHRPALQEAPRACRRLQGPHQNFILKRRRRRSWHRCSGTAKVVDTTAELESFQNLEQHCHRRLVDGCGPFSRPRDKIEDAGQSQHRAKLPGASFPLSTVSTRLSSKAGGQPTSWDLPKGFYGSLCHCGYSE